MIEMKEGGREVEDTEKKQEKKAKRHVGKQTRSQSIYFTSVQLCSNSGEKGFEIDSGQNNLHHIYLDFVES
jgi:hypothetical protein